MQSIPNIKLFEVYDQHQTDADIHYERLERLADHFGRNMPAHYHDRFYQMHVILDGVVHVHLDDVFYTATAPMFFLTPPTIPHAFATESEARGHVLTLQQEVVWMLLGIESAQKEHDKSVIQPLCVELNPTEKKEDQTLLDLLLVMCNEFEQSGFNRSLALQACLQLILVKALRMAESCHNQQHIRKGDTQVFRRFNHLIEHHYKDHWTLSVYAEQVGVTEARLNDICRRLAGLSSKQLVLERVMQQARRLLRFTSMPVTTVGYELGFKDPAYFARFFRRHAGTTASEYRRLNTTL